jgi:hypothetical protein
VELHDDGVAISTVGNVMVCVWRLATSAPRVRMFVQAAERMVSTHPGGQCHLQVIERTSGPPAAAERRAFTDLQRRTGSSTRGIAFVIEGDDAQTWVVRAILRGISLLSRSGVAKTYVGSVNEGISWLMLRGIEHTNQEALEREVARLRALLPVAPLPGREATRELR